MEKLKLVDILRSLDKTEFRDFGKFVRSPYFNNRNEVVRFYDAMKNYYPGFKSRSFTAENIFKDIYPGKRFNAASMRKVVSLTTNLLLDYFSVSSHIANRLEFNSACLNKILNKKLPDLFVKKLKTAEKLLYNSEHTFQYYISRFNYSYTLSSYLHIKDEKAMAENLQNEIDNFTEYSMAIYSLLYFRSATLSRLYNIKYDLKFFDEVVKYFAFHDMKDVTICWLYYNMAMMTITVEEKFFFELESSLIKFRNRLSNEDKYNVFISLYTFCVNKIKSGEEKYRRILFELSKKFWEDYKFTSGYFPPYTYTGLILTAASLKEFSWALEFLVKIKELLDPVHRDELINYSMAYIEFYKNNYQDSLKYLSTISPERSIMKLNTKNLAIMNYYELKYFDEAFSSLDSYRRFLQRDKSINNESKKVNTQFINSVLPLLKFRVSGESTPIQKLKNDILKLPYFSNKDWVLKKFNELIK